MDKAIERIKNGSRVRLRGHIGPEFYNGLAKTGNEGWITQHRYDRNGLPEVYIQWDRTHWADNDQPDRWTYEEHFDIVEEPKMAEDKDMDPAEVAKAIELYRMMKAMNGDNVGGEPSVSDLDAEMKAHYTANAEKARQLIDKGEAFVLIAVTREENDAAPMGELRVGMAHSSLSPETDVLVGSQLSVLAAQYHEDAALTLIHHYTQDRPDAGDL